MRPSKDQWAMEMAAVTAKRSTCLRRHVGCVLLNARGHVLSTGYNGVAAGLPHCNEENKFGEQQYPFSCTGAQAESGKDLDLCQAIHAEQNALLQCRDVHEIDACYVTTSPCITCIKLLLNTSCRQICYHELYSHLVAEDIWLKAGRTWMKV
jgi:dCMP deaminase